LAVQGFLRAVVPWRGDAAGPGMLPTNSKNASIRRDDTIRRTLIARSTGSVQAMAQLETSALSSAHDQHTSQHNI